MNPQKAKCFHLQITIQAKIYGKGVSLSRLNRPRAASNDPFIVYGRHHLSTFSFTRQSMCDVAAGGDRRDVHCTKHDSAGIARSVPISLIGHGTSY